MADVVPDMLSVLGAVEKHACRTMIVFLSRF